MLRIVPPGLLAVRLNPLMFQFARLDWLDWLDPELLIDLNVYQLLSQG